MSTTVQFIGVGVVIACAVGYVLRATWKTWFGARPGCGSGCGKCAAPAPEPAVKGRTPLPMA
ncbi:FeoB-associated Cys-rich membrane protein [Gemmata sp. JC673]|uniref:FeoB-associated Cys-rich membrane protein n=1 Tax=Gemmata algarum TaxID=2975278 RepID=A0ABU5EY91_9BACT|nr:FeoB-associated Cys-rich membrane protein [Gemmata algarum]MDY3560214.1 FeoB-associated Cys-rich membrane protein [Gemmata algarum]